MGFNYKLYAWDPTNLVLLYTKGICQDVVTSSSLTLDLLEEASGSKSTPKRAGQVIVKKDTDPGKVECQSQRNEDNKRKSI